MCQFDTRLHVVISILHFFKYTLWGLISQHKIIITVTEVNLSSFCQTNSITSRWLVTFRKSSNTSSAFGQDIVMMRWVHPVSTCDAFIRILKTEYWLTKPCQYIKIFTWPVLPPEQNQFVGTVCNRCVQFPSSCFVNLGCTPFCKLIQGEVCGLTVFPRADVCG